MISLLTLILILVTIPAHATTRYMGTGGSDSNSCAASTNSATPKLTFNGASGAKTCMSPGDELGVLDGTYAGTSNQLDLRNMTGSSSSSYRIYAVNGPGVAIFTPVTSSDGTACRTFITNSTVRYITIQDLVIDRSTCSSFVTGDRMIDTVNVTFSGVEIKNGYYHGLYISGSTGFTMTGGSIHGATSTCVPGTRSLGLYIHDGSSITISKVDITDMPGGAIQVYPGPLSNIVIDHNKLHDNSSCTTTDVGGIVIASDSTGAAITNVTVKNNEITGNGLDGTGGNGGGVRVYGRTGGFTVSNTLIYNNTIYNNLANSGTAYGVRIENSFVSGTVVRNNIIIGNETGQVTNSGTSSTITHNACTAGDSCGTSKTTIASITACTVSTSNFTLKSGSSCIDAGTNVGLAFNGSAPDIGVYETFTFASCEVPNGAETKIRVTFTNNVAPPLLPSTGATTFTARKNGASNALNGSVARIGDNIFEITVTNSYVGGDTADISWASGNITDSSLIANTTNQPYVQTLSNQACTNNAGGAPSHTFTQARYEFHAFDGAEDAPLILPYGIASTGAAENFTTYPVRVGGKLRLRFSVVCGGADCPPTGFYLYTSTGGDYAQVPDSFGSDNVAFCGVTDPVNQPNNGSTTTDQLSTSGTFVAGGFILTSNAIPTIDLAENNKTELEYCVKFDTDASGDYTFRVYTQSGNALDTYTVTPTITLGPSVAGGSGF